MTNQDFDNTSFGSHDKIVVRKYFRTLIEDIEEVNFEKRTINGYHAAQIVEHIIIDPNNEQ